MKHLIVFLGLACLALAGAAQETDRAAAALEQIKADRAKAEAVFRAEEKACYGKFAVNDCLNAARSRRRQALADLRRQEVALNDAERRRRAAERLRDLEQRQSAEKQAPQAQPPSQAQQRSAPSRPPRPQAQPSRAPDAAASEDATRAMKAERRRQEVEEDRAKEAEQRAQKAALARRNLERHEERLEQARQRREKLEKRLAERKKPPAEPLPVPP